MPVYISRPPLNPLTRLIASVIAVLAVVGAFMLGMMALAVAMVTGLLFWAGLRLRMWWLRRKTGSSRPPRSRPQESQVIEAEYKVVSREED